MWCDLKNIDENKIGSVHLHIYYRDLKGMRPFLFFEKIVKINEKKEAKTFFSSCL